MAQRPSFDMNKLSTADKILLGAALLFVIDSFLPWQRVCSQGVQGSPRECINFSAWGGDAAFLGVFAALLAIILLAAAVAGLAGVSMPPTMPMPAITSWLAFGTAAFAILKFLFIVTNDVGFAAFIGFILAVAIAYGGWMKMQEASVLPPPVGGTMEPGP